MEVEWSLWMSLFTQLMKAVMTTTDNKIFAHYIFMDNEFFLPTATGMPLRIALSGTFTPGIKGGLNIARDMVIVFTVLSSVLILMCYVLLL